jgi:hypothetical protein
MRDVFSGDKTTTLPFGSPGGSVSRGSSKIGKRNLSNISMYTSQKILDKKKK